MRAAISRPDPPGLSRRARRRTSRPTYRWAGGFHDRSRWTDECSDTRRDRAQAAAAPRRRVGKPPKPGIARSAPPERARGRCTCGDFLTFSLYQRKIASNFRVTIGRFAAAKKTASAATTDAVLLRRGSATYARIEARHAASPHCRMRRAGAQRYASAVSTSVRSKGATRAARASSYAYGRVSSMYVICDSSSCTACTPVSGTP